MNNSRHFLADRRSTLVHLVLGLAMVGTVACAPGEAEPLPAATSAVLQPPAGEMPLMIRNGMPGEEHRWLDALTGDWNVEMSLFLAGGTPEKPHMGQNVVSHRRWLDKTGRRFLQEDIEGTMLGQPYYRLGVLGYSTMDKMFEFTTFDQLNANAMSYRGPGDQRRISMTGTFTDQGVLGDTSAGRTIPMRTEIRFETADRNVYDIYFTPPGEPERLIDRKVYTRIR
ncbi:DUF1579 family protein [Amycolatopsis magusensis]|uniref:DUF1579 family protein n=1 Tax=Amycolatopsis magusensis TaxID=882444 RepID=UPI0037AABC3F